VLLVAVLWVWAKPEATASPKITMMNENNVFISGTSFGSI